MLVQGEIVETIKKIPNPNTVLGTVVECAVIGMLLVALVVSLVGPASA